MAANKFIFIGGLHRSGTSILFKCLRDHPEISGFKDTGVPEDEGQHLQNLYPTAKEHGGPGRFGFDSKVFLDENSPLVSPQNAEALFSTWQQYWDTNKSLLLEKSPPNLVRGRFLQALFPNSYFIMLLRHPVAVAFATQKWSKTPLEQLLRHWFVCHKQMRKDIPYLRNSLVLRYEDFIAEPEKNLQLIYQFVGVDSQPLTQEIHTKINDKYFSNWHELKLNNKLSYYHLWLKYQYAAKKFGYSLSV
jgi:hypothetical protein